MNLGVSLDMQSNSGMERKALLVPQNFKRDKNNQESPSKAITS